ncbi:AMP-dependent synthetase [Novosphingobium sp. PC22D]|uniref:class I adenylate-forming enzyme family protein n=1 Tax=Novosphingobium sp. PC22D TaxID=1962403 RepID=UPI000BFB1238|nr:class I adenylate-forming enzyme family protein [Novosphingobium sp. PC22D]PEQ12786.1 AMP-dependent synthetase [Novosphingobium sp. PC22D]
MSETEPPSTVPALLAGHFAARAERDAVAMVGETITYAELDARTSEMARALLAAGAGKGARIALLAPDGIFWVTAFLAALRMGALITVVSTLCTPRELAHILRNSDVQYLLAARRFLSHDYGEKLQTAFPELAGQAPGAIRLEGAPFLRDVWMDDVEGLSWAAPREDLLALGEAPGAPGPAILAAIEAEVTPADDAVIVYTSGSTSMPKAVVHSQWTLARHPRELAKLFVLKPDDRMMPMLPAFWLGGMAMLMQVMSKGATLVYPASPDHADLLAAIETLDVNRVNGWGDGLARLREAAAAKGIDVDAIMGLGPFRDEAGDLIPPQLSSNLLGMSETFAPHSGVPINVRLPEDKPGASGPPVNRFERRIVDPDTGTVLGANEVGELHLRGGGLMSGFYKKRPCDVFTPDGFYPTGDLCRIDEDDYLTFVARRNDMIKTRAANVSRLEVEAALARLPGVAMAVVTGLPHAEYGEMVAAAVVPAAGAEPDEAGLRAALKDEISSYKIPRRIVFVEEAAIPRTATGKLRLHELGEMIAAKLG